MIRFGAAKKIVRLIFMSNISRRSFLKGAGVAALAVAAAGVLAGCSDKETPDTGAKRDVKLKYLSTVLVRSLAMSSSRSLLWQRP